MKAPYKKKVTSNKRALSDKIQERFPRERDFQNHIIWLAKAHGWRYYHTFNSRKSVSGFPDLTLVRGRRLIFAEVKQDTTHPTKTQREWLSALDKTRAEVYVWRPKDLKAITEILSRKDEGDE